MTPYPTDLPLDLALKVIQRKATKQEATKGGWEAAGFGCLKFVGEPGGSDGPLVIGAAAAPAENAVEPLTEAEALAYIQGRQPADPADTAIVAAFDPLAALRLAALVYKIARELGAPLPPLPFFRAA